MTPTRRIAALMATAAAAVAMTAAPAGAAEPEARDFADHVRMCQSHEGFDGLHNPGVMHQGLAGWEAHHAS